MDSKSCGCWAGDGAIAPTMDLRLDVVRSPRLGILLVLILAVGCSIMPSIEVAGPVWVRYSRWSSR